MSMTYIEAVDELFGMLLDVVHTESAAIIGYEPEIRWPGEAAGIKPPKERYWSRASEQIVTDGQVSLANAQGIKVYEATGLCYLQIFCPRNLDGSLDKGRLFAQAVRNKFRRGSPSGEIWFRNQRIVKQPETAEAYPLNVVIEFSFKTYGAPDALGFGETFDDFVQDGGLL